MIKIEDLSTNIGISSGYLKILLINHDKYYKTYYIKKRSGNKERLIASPNFEIKAIQSCILRNYLNKIEISERAMGFAPKRSIRLNASFHLGQKFIMCLDIKNFFPSIKKEKIYQVINSHFNDDFLSYFISELSTYKGTLPQGGVTSPILSNIVFKPLDDLIKKLCSENNINYSRYADDLCFSSNYLPSLIDLEPQVREILKGFGFNLNHKKTRYMSGKNKKMVTGLLLNSDRVTAGRGRKRIVRSALYNHIIKDDNNINLNEIYGMVSFISSIESEYKEKINKYIQSLRSKKKSLQHLQF